MIEENLPANNGKEEGEKNVPEQPATRERKEPFSMPIWVVTIAFLAIGYSISFLLFFYAIDLEEGTGMGFLLTGAMIAAAMMKIHADRI